MQAKETTNRALAPFEVCEIPSAEALAIEGGFLLLSAETVNCRNYLVGNSSRPRLTDIPDGTSNTLM